VALSFWSMVAVAASGYLGRYLYQQIPRTLSDNELSLSEIEHEISRLNSELKMRTNLSDEVLDRVNSLFDRAFEIQGRGLYSMIARLFWNDLKRPFLRRRLRRGLARIAVVSKPAQRDMFDLARQRSLLRRRMALLGKIHTIFHYWHVIHKPFAIVMYVIMIVHVGVAVWTGYAWLN